MPIAYYGSRISPHITRTPEGYLICHDVPINRIGLYKYLGREIGREGADTEKEFGVMRRPEEVFSPAALSSFEGKPITNGHPPEDVTPDNIHIYGKGHIQNVRKGSGNNDGYTIADVWITDPDLIDEVERGKRDISCGYVFDLFENPNHSLEQRAIRGNHVAVVENGRAGSRVSIKDSKNTERRSHMAKEGSILGKALKALARDESVTPDDMEKAAKELGGKPAAAKDEDEGEITPKKEETKTPGQVGEDEMQSTGLESKLDELLELLKPICAELVKKPAEDSDELADIIDPERESGELSAEGEEERQLEGGDEFDPMANEESVTIDPEDIKQTGRDAASTARVVRNILRKNIKDPVAFKAAAKDAAADIRKVYGIGPANLMNTGYGRFTAATREAASKKAHDAASSEKAVEAAQAAYDARNPHKKKEDK